MNETETRTAGERGSIEPRKGRSGLGGMFDWDPFRTLFPSNFQQAFGIDVNRTQDGYEVEMPVPGYRPEELDVSFQDGVITVSGKSERRNFTRSLSVPDDVDEDSIQARVENGMLTILLKQHPARQPKRISITAGSQGMQQVGSQGSTGSIGTTSGTRTTSKTPAGTR